MSWFQAGGIGGYLQNRLPNSSQFFLTVGPGASRDLINFDYFSRVMREVITCCLPEIFKVGSWATTWVDSTALRFAWGFGTGLEIMTDNRVTDEIWLDVVLPKDNSGLTCDAGRLEHSLCEFAGVQRHSEICSCVPGGSPA